MDLAHAQLNEAKSQATWVNSDVSNIHGLAVQLNSQKVISNLHAGHCFMWQKWQHLLTILMFQVELQEHIATQDSEIEKLHSEIRSLRQEVENVTKLCEAEREKAEVLQEQVAAKGSRKHAEGER